MRTFLLATLLVAAPAAFAANHGEPMPEGETIPLATAAADPEAHAGKPAKYAGRITEVCQKKGCWVVLEQDGQTARVMAKDHGFEVPRDSTGAAIAYGVLEMEPISEAHARHLVEDDGASAPAERELRIVATAISIGD